MNKIEVIQPPPQLTPRPGSASINRGDIASAATALLLVNETDDFKRGVLTLAVALGVENPKTASQIRRLPTSP